MLGTFKEHIYLLVIKLRWEKVQFLYSKNNIEYFYHILSYYTFKNIVALVRHIISYRAYLNENISEIDVSM